jgi:hypothetical protein
VSIDPEAIYDVVARHREQLFERATWRTQPSFPMPSTEEPWSSFGDEARFVEHRRRVFVAKFNRRVWGDPFNPEPWRAGRPSSWLYDAYGAGRGIPANSSPALRTIRAGDLVVVMSIDGTDEQLLGVWLVVLAQRWRDPFSPRREMWPGHFERVGTEVFHVPLVRFTRDVVVRVVRDRIALLDADPEFTERNRYIVEVADPDGGRQAAARLLAACSLPGNLLTCANPLALRQRLAAKQTGMRDADYRHWKDMNLRHKLVRAIEDTAVVCSRADILRRGYDFTDFWDHQHDGGWGGDYECFPTTAPGGPLAVEVKGTGYRKWLGRIRLEQSQYDRALRHANGRPLPNEVGYGWELHIQPEIVGPSPDLTSLPPLVVRQSAFVRDEWPKSCINRRRSRNQTPGTPAR